MLDWKKILIASLVGAMVYPVIRFLVTVLLVGAFPFDPFGLPGTRSFSDPVIWSYLVYPFLLSLIFAFVYHLVHSAIPGKGWEKGLAFGGLIFLIETIPNLFLVFSSMVYPTNFYVHHVIENLLTFLALGLICTLVWTKIK